jgi:NADH-quinone oxidoreductase subunit G
MLGKKLDSVEFECVRGSAGIKEAELELGGHNLRIAVVSGLGNIRKALDDMKSGKKYDVLELMACPGGCINGGGQPKSKDPDILKKRAEALFSQDRKLSFRIANENPDLHGIYEYLGKPLGRKAKSVLHTSYDKREIELDRD